MNKGWQLEKRVKNGKGMSPIVGSMLMVVITMSIAATVYA